MKVMSAKGSLYQKQHKGVWGGRGGGNTGEIEWYYEFNYKLCLFKDPRTSPEIYGTGGRIISKRCRSTRQKSR